MSQQRFTAGQASEATGVPYSRLNYWARNGVLAPSIQQSSGSDSCRVYSFADLVALRTLWLCRQLGIEAAAVQSVIEDARQGREWSSTRVGNESVGITIWLADIAGEVRAKLPTLKAPERGKAVLAVRQLTQHEEPR